MFKKSLNRFFCCCGEEEEKKDAKKYFVRVHIEGVY